MVDDLIISIHAPLTGSDKGSRKSCRKAGISIHAPLTGSDENKVLSALKECEISIHAPLTGSDEGRRRRADRQIQFQSTLPSQGATRTSTSNITRYMDFNPRSPHRERQIAPVLSIPVLYISTHAPLTGSDSKYTHKIPL